MKNLNYTPENGGNISKRLSTLETTVTCVPYTSGELTVIGLAPADGVAETLAFTAGESDRFKIDATSGSIKVESKGVYVISVAGNVVAKDDTGAAVLTVDILVNGTSILTTANVNTTNAFLPYSASGTIVYPLDALDEITFTLTLTGDDGDTDAADGSLSFSIYKLR